MHTHRDDLDVAHALADLARAAILPHFRALTAVDDKPGRPGFDPVTEADRRAEAVMRTHLETVRPEDGVLGEEFEPKPSQNGRTWILDPVDGTRAFLMGLPTWGTLIALSPAPGAAPHVGLMDQPYVNERFFAGPDGAGWRRDDLKNSIHAKRCASLDTALAATTSPNLFSEAVRPRYDRLEARVRMMRFGTDCYAYALLAAGHVDLVMEEGLRVYDIAPFVPLVEQAGGAITDFSGNPIGPMLLTNFRGEALAVGDPSLLEPALDALNG